ncbi:MAG: hypothetical protein I8H87_13050 [Comamonadaceae bacterium]|nr:hypothetical protein [Comamonadaceae bacterium]
MQCLESTLTHLGDKVLGLLHADGGFFDNDFLTVLEAKQIPCVIAAKPTQALQRTIYPTGGLTCAISGRQKPPSAWTCWPTT